MKSYFQYAALLILFAIRPYAGNTQAFRYEMEHYLEKTTARTVKIQTGYQFTFPTTQPNFYFECTGKDPASPEIFRCNNWPNFNLKTVNDFVIVQIDRGCKQPMSAFDFTFTFNVVSYEGASPTGAMLYIPGTYGSAFSSTPPSPKPISLSVTYDPTAGAKYKDVDIYKFSNGQRIELTLTGVYDNKTGSQVSLAAIPDCIEFVRQIDFQRLDNIGTALPTVLLSMGTSSATLEWRFPCTFFGNTALLQPPSGVEYELEYQYVDNYYFNTNSWALEDLFSHQGNTVHYNFPNNSTRVRLQTNTYTIPTVYERGALVYRIRTVRPDLANFDNVIYGPWSLPDAGSLAKNSINVIAIDQGSDFSPNLNWQYSINFAEEGKYKNVINYFDGGLKNRQTQTKINSDPTHIVAVDKAFDYEGRNSITSLPVPVQQNGLGYRPDILVKSNGSAISPADIDSRGGSSTACVIPGAAPPQLSATSSIPSLAELYYSPTNPLNTAGNLHRFVPQAEGFPYIQTIFAPENSGKVLAQGGAGPVFQLYTGGHYTLNDYMIPTQSELDRLLGTEAGSAQFYPKSVNIDPNGQASVSLLNKYGKPVMSYLAGASPVQLQAIRKPDQSAIVPTLETDDLLLNFEQTRGNRQISADRSFYLDIPGGSGLPTLGYSLDVKPFVVCGLGTQDPQGNFLCSGCNALQIKGYLDLDVVNSCGTSVLSGPNAYDKVIGGNYASPASPASTKLVKTYSNILSTSPLPGAGTHRITKRLRFERRDMVDAMEQLMTSHPRKYTTGLVDPCTYRTQADFIRQEVEKIDKPCTVVDESKAESNCNGAAARMQKELLPQAKYGKFVANANGIYLGPHPSQNNIFDLYATDPYEPPVGIQLDPNGFYGAVGEFIGACSSPSPAPPAISGWSYKWEPGGSYSSNLFYDGVQPISGTSNCYYGLRPATNSPSKLITYKTTVVVAYPELLQNNNIQLIVRMDGGATVHSYKVNSSQQGGLHPDGLNYRQHTTTLNLSGLQLGSNDVEISICSNQPYKGIYDVILATVFKFVNNCNGCYTESKRHRFQAPCISFPVVYFDGNYYGDANATHNGQPVIDLHTVSPHTFLLVYNANKEEISRALLPLHPEYCKLQVCDDQDFLDLLNSTRSYDAANALGLLNLTGLNSLTNRDPIANANNNSSSVIDRLTHVPGGGAAYPQDDLRSKLISKIALEIAYCGGTDNVQNEHCRSHLFQAEIAAGVVSPEIKERYWSVLKQLYLTSHNWVKAQTMDGRNASCEPCKDQRMSWIGPDYAITPLTSGSGFASDLFALSGQDAAELNLNQLYGMDDVSVLNNAINSPGAGIPEVAGTEDKMIAGFLEPFALYFQIIGLSQAHRDNIIAFLKTKRSNGKITPQDVENALTSNTVALSARIDPYLLDYNLVNGSSNKELAFACAPTSVYTDIRNFANQLVGITANPFVISNTDPYQARILQALGQSGPTAVNISATDDPIGGRFVRRYTITVGSASVDLFIKELNHTNGLPSFPSTFTAAECVYNQFGNTTGLVLKNSAILSDGAGRRYMFYSRQIPVMSNLTDPELYMAVNAWDIKDGLEAYLNRPAPGGVSYTKNPSHPAFISTLTNFLNYRLNQNYTYDQYESLMKGCALSDYVALPKSIAYLDVLIPSGNTWAINAFMDGIEGMYDTYPKWNAGTNLIKLSYTESGVRHFLLDLSSIPDRFLEPAIGIISGLASAYGNVVEPVASPSIAATVFSSSIISSWPAGISVNSSGPAVLNNHNGNVNVNKYVLGFSVSTPEDKSNALAALPAAVQGSHTAICYQHVLHRSADYSALKQAYLDKVILDPNITSHPDAVNAVAANHVGSQLIASNATAGNSFTYTDARCSGRLRDFHISSTTAGNAILYDALGGYSSLVSAVTGSVKQTLAGEYKRQLRKADGSYWFVYIKYPAQTSPASDHGYYRYNSYVIPPPGVDIAGYTLDRNTIQLAQADAQGHYTGFTIKAKLGTTVVDCKGYTDYAMASSGIAARLSNVILYDGSDATCVPANDCEYAQLLTAIESGKAAYQQYHDNEVNAVVTRYTAFLQDPANVTESMVLTHTSNKYQYTLYFYDRAGNLMRTVPPQSAVPYAGTVATIDAARKNPSLQYTKYIPYNKASSYRFNSLNQPFQQTTPDAGTTKFWYDDKGRIAFSRNAVQALKVPPRYTYNLYDDQGRPVETGEVLLPLGPNAIPSGIITKLEQHETINYDVEIRDHVRNQSRQDVVLTQYDEQTLNAATDGVTGAALASADYKLTTQENLRKRVASVKYFRLVGNSNIAPTTWDDNPDYALHYSYDVLGNVKTLTHEIKRLAGMRQKFKRIDYDYDLLSGKVNAVSYNRGFPDQFYHRYGYDADNRIVNVKTSHDGIIWAEDAHYDYYKHGPLARVVLGDLGVQSMEYAYTIQGWLKAINGDLLNPNADMGGNGRTITSGPVETIARDAVAHSLQYFAGDYKAIGTTGIAPQVEHLAGTPGYTALTASQNLYNGNIARQYTSIAQLDPVAGQADLYHGMERSYQYDQLNRIIGASNKVLDNNSGTISANTPANLYASTYKYDADGNILELKRWNGGSNRGNPGTGSASQIDGLTYSYTKPSPGFQTNDHHNQLQDVTEAIGATGGSDLQPYTPGSTRTYRYDAIGNLIRDNRENMDIDWNLYGKVRSIIKGTGAQRLDLQYAYDGMGNRISKTSIKTINAGLEQHQGEYYIRDAAGNVLAVYNLASDYGRANLFGQIHISFVESSSSSGLASFIKSLADNSSSLSNVVLDNTLSLQNSWAVSESGSHDVAYYFAADPSLPANILLYSDEYLDDLRSYDPGTSVTGLSLTRDAVMLSDPGMRAQLFEQVLQNPAAGEAMLRGLASTLNPNPLVGYWMQFGVNYQPGNPMQAAQVLYNAINNSGQFSMAANDLVHQVLQQAPPPEQEAFYNGFLSNPAIQTNGDLRIQPGVITTYEQVLMDIINQNADQTELTGFIGNWSGAPAWLDNHTTLKQRLELVYATEPVALLERVINQDLSIIDLAVAAEPSLSFAEYAERIISTGNPGVPQQVSLNTALQGEELTLAEHHLYGSSRLGIQHYNANPVPGQPALSALKNKWVLNNPGATFYHLTHQKATWWSASYDDLMAKTSRVVHNASRDLVVNLWNNNESGSADGSGLASYGSYRNARRTLGWRQYELSDHLGNVLASVLDRKLGVGSHYDPGTTTNHVNYFRADVASAQDYYPFGMLMPGRTFTLAGMDGRYGFNGQQRSDEVYGIGAAINFDARIFDTRVARWLGVDPLQTRYPETSPYTFVGNSPLQFVDPDGRAIRVYYSENRWVDYTPGIKPVNSNALINLVHEAVTYNMNTEIGRSVWTALSAASQILAIRLDGSYSSSDFQSQFGEKTSDGKDMLGTITWDFNSSPAVSMNSTEYLNEAVSGYQKGYLTPSTVLFHEGGHGYIALQALLTGDDVKINSYKDSKNTESNTGYDPQYDTKEERLNTIKFEQVYVRQINSYEQKNNPNPTYQPIRYNHKAAYHSGYDNRHNVGVNAVEAANVYKEWRQEMKSKGYQLNDGVE